MSKSADDFKFLIKITNFINPHLFHFKLDDALGQLDADTQKLLAKTVDETKLSFRAGYNPKQDELVLAFITEWNKWVRAQVDLILEERSIKRYVLWCMDDGLVAILLFGFSFSQNCSMSRNGPKFGKHLTLDIYYYWMIFLMEIIERQH